MSVCVIVDPHNSPINHNAMVKIKPIKKTRREGLADDILASTYVSADAVPSFDEPQLSTVQKQRNEKKIQKENEQTIDLNKILKVMRDNDKEEDIDIQIDDVDMDMQEYDDEEIPELTEQEVETIQQFSNPKLGDAADSLKSVLIKKIMEKNQEEMTETELEERIHPQIVHTYKLIGKLLHKYKHGKLPKAFIVLPTLSMWEEALYLTNPDQWSNPAVYQATKVFLQMPEAQVQRFLSLVLLPKFRLWMKNNKKLNYHLYQALLKSCFKSGAFFKGIVIPLCEAGDCKHSESVVIGSVIKKKSVPLLHAAAALLRITMIPYTATYDTILKSIIEKKYSLPTKVVAGVLNYFVNFRNENRKLPIVWHQTLLLFVQLYKHDLSREDKQRLLLLIEAQRSAVTQDIKRELLSRSTMFHKTE